MYCYSNDYRFLMRRKKIHLYLLVHLWVLHLILILFVSTCRASRYLIIFSVVLTIAKNIPMLSHWIPRYHPQRCPPQLNVNPVIQRCPPQLNVAPLTQRCPSQLNVTLLTQGCPSQLNVALLTQRSPP